MELTLAILMVLGIFVGIPAIIGFTIGGVYTLRDHKFRKAERAKAVAEAKATVGESTKEHATVAQH